MPKYTLVDWYGKRQTFDRDTIYAEGEDGGLVPFTQGAGNPVIEPLNATQNGVYTPPVGVNGFGPVSVNVPDLPPVLQSKEATQNGEYTPDSGYDGLSKVTVNVPAPVLEPLIVTENGNYTPGAGKDGFNSVTVAVQAPEIKLQEKTATVNGTYTADAGFDGLAKVLVNVAASGGTLVAKKGTFTGNGSYVTFNHNLGVVPSVIFCYSSDGLYGMSSNNIGFAIGMNQETASKMGLTQDQQYGIYWNSYSNTWAITSPDYPIDSATIPSYDSTLFSNVTATSIRIGDSSNKTKDAAVYTWYAFGIQKD